MDSNVMKYDIDHLESLGRKDGILFVQKGYHRGRDLVYPLISSLLNNVILISFGRNLEVVNENQPENLKSVIRIIKKEPSGLLNWTDDLSQFNYTTNSLEKAVVLSIELAHRGDIVLFSPFENKEKVYELLAQNRKLIDKTALSV